MNGFTLIELLVVVLIIGILSAVALPQYQKAVLKSRASTGWARVKAMETAQTEYLLANGNYTTDLDNLSINVGNWKCFAAGDNQGGYCQFNLGKIMWEIRLYFYNNRPQQYEVICIARAEGGQTAKSVCADYHDSNGRITEMDNGSTYYSVRTVWP